MIENYDIICISTMDWEGVWGSRQSYMKILSQHNRIFFVQQHIGPEHIIKHPQFIKKIYALLFKRIKKFTDNIWLIEPLILIPGKLYSKIIYNINQIISLWYLKKLLKKFNLKNIILWFYDPYYSKFINNFNEEFSLYFCIDFFSATSKGKKKFLIDTYEKELIKKTNLNIVYSDKLLRDKLKIDKNAKLVRNGCDYYNIRKIMEADLSKPSELVNIKPPIIGHMGSVNSKLDLELIEFLALRHPYWNFVFIGNIFYAELEVSYIMKLKKLKNIFFLGHKKRSEILKYEKFFDICLNIYIINEWTKFIQPLKIFEYLATGKPIVSSYLPELEEFKDIIFFSNTYEEFEKTILKIFSGELKNDVHTQLKFAEKYSWHSRAEEVSKLIKMRFRNV